MLRKQWQTFGMAIAGVCLVATFAVAQAQYPSPSQGQARGREMTCTQEDVKGNCTAATGAEGKTVAVVGENAHVGDKMTCVQAGDVTRCTRLTKK
jgi:hypothetical protein